MKRILLLFSQQVKTRQFIINTYIPHVVCLMINLLIKNVMTIKIIYYKQLLSN